MYCSTSLGRHGQGPHANYHHTIAVLRQEVPDRHCTCQHTIEIARHLFYQFNLFQSAFLRKIRGKIDAGARNWEQLKTTPGYQFEYDDSTTRVTTSTYVKVINSTALCSRSIQNYDVGQRMGSNNFHSQ